MRKKALATLALLGAALSPGAVVPTTPTPVVDAAPATSAPDTAPTQSASQAPQQVADKAPPPTGARKRYCQTATAVYRVACSSSLAVPGAKFERSSGVVTGRRITSAQIRQVRAIKTARGARGA